MTLHFLLISLTGSESNLSPSCVASSILSILLGTGLVFFFFEYFLFSSLHRIHSLPHPYLSLLLIPSHSLAVSCSTKYLRNSSSILSNFLVFLSLSLSFILYSLPSHTISFIVISSVIHPEMHRRVESNGIVEPLL